MRFFAVLSILLLCGCIGGEGVGGAAVAVPSRPNMMPEDPRAEDDAGEPTAEYTDPGACEGREGNLKDLCYINTASELMDVKICDKVSVPEHRELCIGRVGVATGNRKLCDRISDPSVRAQCHMAIT
ncbi:MAG: hypothetical protein GF416_04605 [Candidatus Altiarchaeales archaeon]|nr:hypothetical protein [Candidatus Altiarchaeales archaeon]MBD3416401.1 hypothetical protein [Candidatus Altiarchaeales archaeon]